ncbi:xylosyl- and glucuronyltransferase LARGE2s-like isoform X2 [Ptychodera flava]
MQDVLQTLPQWTESLKKVIVIGVSTTLNGDILKIWNQFDDFNHDQVFGVSRSEIGKPGLLLANISASSIQQDDYGKFDDLWKDVFQNAQTNSRHDEYLVTTLDTAVRLHHNSSTKELPCNVNINAGEDLEGCVTDIHEVLSFTQAYRKAPGQRYSVYQEYFESVYEAIAEHDGNLLRRRFIKCQSFVRFPQVTNKTKKCASIVQRETLTLRTHLFYHGGHDLDIDAYSVTMAMQADFSRFIQMIDMISSYWLCPMSIALYATDEEASRLLRVVKFSGALSTRKDIAIHIAFVDRDFEHYPVNHLRNVAKEGVITNYLFVSEVDFFYSADICQNLRYLISEIDDRERTMDKKAIVVPAFESRILTERSLPVTKDELVERYLNEEYEYFHQTKYPGGHKPTDYERWIDATEEYRIRWNRGYEPYLVLKTQDCPDFPKIFSGRGFNKGSHTMILVAQGYRLLVSPNTFMIHMPHWLSSGRKLYLDDEHYQKCLSWAKVHFDQSLYKKYNITERDLRRGGF